MDKKTLGIIGAIIIGGIIIVAIFASKGGNSDGMDMNSSENNMSQTSTAVQETDKVSYKNFAASPQSIRVKKGTTVTWTNEDSAKHDVTPDMETADFKASKLFGKGETYQVTFNTVGTYTYYCSPHPYMKGTVEVTE